MLILPPPFTTRCLYRETMQVFLSVSNILFKLTKNELYLRAQIMKLSVQIQLSLCFKPWQEIKNLKVLGLKKDVTLALESITPHLPPLLLDS